MTELLPAAPLDDGAAAHLPGRLMPPIALPSTHGGTLRVDEVPNGSSWLVLYAYPRTGRPGAEDPPGWDLIPGARGCTPEACAFRDHAADLAVHQVLLAGISTQDSGDQAEVAERMHLPFPLLSDDQLALTTTLRLPTFETAGMTLLKRLTRTSGSWTQVTGPHEVSVGGSSTTPVAMRTSSGQGSGTP